MKLESRHLSQQALGLRRQQPLRVPTKTGSGGKVHLPTQDIFISGPPFGGKHIDVASEPRHPGQCH